MINLKLKILCKNFKSTIKVDYFYIMLYIVTFFEQQNLLL